VAAVRGTIDLNLMGSIICVKQGGGAMETQGVDPARGGRGAIVLMSSGAGRFPHPHLWAYGVAKAGICFLAETAGEELGPLGIRVNAVAPGPVDTAMAKAVHTAEIRADYHDAIPLNRYGLEEELAEAIFFLSSERSSYITGQVLAVDGGFDAAGIGLPTLRGQRRNG